MYALMVLFSTKEIRGNTIIAGILLYHSIRIRQFTRDLALHIYDALAHQACLQGKVWGG